MNDHNGTGSIYGDPRAAEGYANSIGPATSPLSTVAFVDATGNPYETNKSEYERLLREVKAMEDKYPELKGKVNLTLVKVDDMASIKAAIAETESRVREEEGKKIQEAVMGGAVALTGLGLAAEAAAGMGGKAPVRDLMGAEAIMMVQKDRQPVDQQKEVLLASLTREQRDAPARNGVSGGDDISERALFTSIRPIGPDVNKAREQERDTGYSGRSLSA